MHVLSDEAVAALEKVSPGFSNLSSDNATKRLLELATIGATHETRPTKKAPKSAGEVANAYIGKTYTGPVPRTSARRAGPDHVTIRG
jgi:hypothetical protein